MVKDHIKRIKAPKTWRIIRKEKIFISKPNPGAHNQKLSVAINTFLKDMTNTTKTSKESKYLLTKQVVLHNGKRIKDDKHAVGLFDIITIPSLNKTYRIIIDKTNSLYAKELKSPEKELLIRVNGKSVLGKNKVQINTRSGSNMILSDKEAKQYSTGDTIIIEFPSNKILKHIKREKGVQVLIYTGKHVGKTGTLESIEGNVATIKSGKQEVQTNKNYIIVTGKDKSEINIEK